MYPVFVGIVAGGVSVPSYVQLCDALGTVNSVSPLYQCKSMVFASQFACKFDVPEYVSSGAYLQSAVDALDAISGSANEEKINVNTAKQIVPICFIAFKRLPVCVCVCVCVCVGFCGFQLDKKY